MLYGIYMSFDDSKSFIHRKRKLRRLRLWRNRNMTCKGFEAPSWFRVPQNIPCNVHVNVISSNIKMARKRNCVRIAKWHLRLSPLKNKLGHIVERLWHVGEVADLLRTIFKRQSFCKQRYKWRERHSDDNSNSNSSSIFSMPISSDIEMSPHRCVCVYVCGSIHDCSAIRREHLCPSSGSKV